MKAVLAIALIALAGCSSEPDLSPVSDIMKDPDSTKFRNVIEYENSVCGEVNSKNSYGAYSGFQDFIMIGARVILAPLDTIEITDTDSIVNATEQARFSLEKMKNCK